jgi:hypothetical protein
MRIKQWISEHEFLSCGVSLCLGALKRDRLYCVSFPIQCAKNRELASRFWIWKLWKILNVRYHAFVESLLAARGI